VHLPGCPLFTLPEGVELKSEFQGIVPMTAEERRKLLDTPLIFNVYGSAGHATGGKKFIDGNYVEDNRDADATERKGGKR
jgi:hypothetical protein